MEDIRLGRSLATITQFKEGPDGPPALLLPADTRRTRVAFYAINGVTTLLLPESYKTLTGYGMQLRFNLPPLIFRIEEFGRLVTDEWWCTGDGAVSALFVVTSTLDKQ